MFSLKYVSKKLIRFLEEKRLDFFVLCEFYKGKSWNFSETQRKFWIWTVYLLLLSGIANEIAEKFLRGR